MKIGIVGGGGWGTALAKIAANNAEKVILWVREDEVREEIRLKRVNSTFLPGAELPSNINPVDDFSSFRECQLVLMVVPSSYVRATAEKLVGHLTPGTLVANAAKGFEISSGKRLSVVLGEVLGPEHPIAVLSGPNIANEVGRGLPSATVAAAVQHTVAAKLQDSIMTNMFRVYTNNDLVGVELGGALKNIIALAAGVVDGLGYGDNTKAALMTRGLTEIVRLGRALGAQPSTFAGLSGMGDLIVTCASPFSRNRRAGLALGQGKTLEEIVGGTNMVIEGVNATLAAYNLAKQHRVELPITQALYDVLFNKRNPVDAVTELMARDRKTETEEQFLPFSDF